MSLHGDIVTERLTARPLPAGTSTVRAILTSEDGILLCYGTTKPADAATGYATGCLFLHTDGSDTTALYVNRGSATSAAFDAVPKST